MNELLKSNRSGHSSRSLPCVLIINIQSGKIVFPSFTALNRNKGSGTDCQLLFQKKEPGNVKSGDWDMPKAYLLYLVGV